MRAFSHHFGAAVPPDTGSRMRPRRKLLAIVAAGAMLAISQPAVAEQVLHVDFTVHETLPVTQGRIVRGFLPDCPNAIVRTLRAGSSQRDGVSTFSGSKRIDCGSGNTLTLAFKTEIVGCGKTSTGAWEVMQGTGLFASARGRGKLAGTYTLGNATGTSCNSDGVNDRYTGQLRY